MDTSREQRAAEVEKDLMLLITKHNMPCAFIMGFVDLPDGQSWIATGFTKQPTIPSDDRRVAMTKFLCSTAINAVDTYGIVLESHTVKIVKPDTDPGEMPH